jgi:hypothetical protein
MNIYFYLFLAGDSEDWIHFLEFHVFSVSSFPFLGHCVGGVS